ncbi:MAG: hypothetical protein Q8P67_20275 [archaeon]|nr:hypothetical protein [archaeon]
MAAVAGGFSFLNREIQEVLDLALSLDAQSSGRVAMQAYLSGSFSFSVFVFFFRCPFLLSSSGSSFTKI